MGGFNPPAAPECHFGKSAVLKRFVDLLKRYNSPGLTVGPKGMHIVFCLDESGSMHGARWNELVHAFNVAWATIADGAGGGPPTYASVVQFSNKANNTITMQ